MQTMIEPNELERRCKLLRSLHVPGTPLELPNAWDAASARAVVAAGFPVVATTSGGVAATLGYEDHQKAPVTEMLAAAARIVRSVDVPVTVDAEAGYGMEPADLVAALRSAGAAGCNLEDTNHTTGEVRDPSEQAKWLGKVREAASHQGYGLVINARIDVFLSGVLTGSNKPAQAELMADALLRAHTYFEAGADCVYPIFLWEPEVLGTFIEQAGGPVNILAFRLAPSLAELIKLRVARISYGVLLHRDVMEKFKSALAAIAR
jgi:2-methylisocitrate lyase-like PEP mutase family enzyme